MKALSINESIEIMVSILRQFDKFCGANNICYYLAFGTMLGAVRNEGMIPWDYDIDIFLKRDDYEKVITQFPQKNTADYLELLEHRINPEYSGKIARIRDKRTIRDGNKEDYYSPTRSLCIELYPLDYYVPNTLNNTVCRVQTYLCLKVLQIKNIKRNSTRQFLKKWILNSMQAVLSMVSTQMVLNHFDRVSQKFNSTSTDYLVWMPYILKNKYYPASIFSERVKAKYEGLDVFIPRAFAQFLTIQYGDYLSLPTEEEISKSMEIRNQISYSIESITQ